MSYQDKLHVHLIMTSIGFCSPQAHKTSHCVIFFLQMPNNIAKVKENIIGAENTIHKFLLMRVWLKINYRLDLCRVTRDKGTERP